VTVLGLGLTLLATVCSAANHDFNGVVADIAHSYHLKPQRMPMISLVSLCTRMATNGGLRGLRIAEFDEPAEMSKDAHGSAVDLPALVRLRLGEHWSAIVMEHSSDASEDSAIFAMPHGNRMRLLIADRDHAEIDVVRMELDGSALAKWMQDPEGQSRQYRKHVTGSQEPALHERGEE
jgi:hypothetical protein